MEIGIEGGSSKEVAVLAVRGRKSGDKRKGADRSCSRKYIISRP
jgi:hypothetical protein